MPWKFSRVFENKVTLSLCWARIRKCFSSCASCAWSKVKKDLSMSLETFRNCFFCKRPESNVKEFPIPAVLGKCKKYPRSLSQRVGIFNSELHVYLSSTPKLRHLTRKTIPLCIQIVAIWEVCFETTPKAFRALLWRMPLVAGGETTLTLEQKDYCLR